MKTQARTILSRQPKSNKYTKSIMVRVDEKLYKTLRKICTTTGLSMNATITRLIVDVVDKK